MLRVDSLAQAGCGNDCARSSVRYREESSYVQFLYLSIFPSNANKGENGEEMNT